MKEFFRTSKVTGSSATLSFIGSAPHLDNDVEIFIDFGTRARRDHDSGIELLDHRWPGERKTSRQIGALIDGRLDDALIEPDGPSTLRSGRLARWFVNGEFRFRHDADGLQIETEQADRRL